MHISKKVRTFLGIGVISVPILVAILFGVVTSDKEERCVGANGSAASYSVGIPRTTYDTPEEAICASLDEDYEEEKQLFKIKNNDIIHVYTQNYYDTFDEQKNIVSGTPCFNCYDVLEKDMRYYYLGSRTTFVNFSPSADKFTWEETFRGDLYDSRSNYDNYFARKIYKSILAWGVSDNSKIESVTVDGQKIDEVHTIDVDGKEYSLWIIYDLQTENKAANVVIEEN